jgi:hypothetical protein
MAYELTSRRADVMFDDEPTEEAARHMLAQLQRSPGIASVAQITGHGRVRRSTSALILAAHDWPLPDPATTRTESPL